MLFFERSELNCYAQLVIIIKVFTAQIVFLNQKVASCSQRDGSFFFQKQATVDTSEHFLHRLLLFRRRGHIRWSEDNHEEYGKRLQSCFCLDFPTIWSDFTFNGSPVTFPRRATSITRLQVIYCLTTARPSSSWLSSRTRVNLICIIALSRLSLPRKFRISTLDFAESIK